jgi:hypothetical protein
MTREERLTLDAMIEYGGGFAKALAAAFVAADPTNRETIKRSFPEMFSRYGAMGIEQEFDLTRDRMFERQLGRTMDQLRITAGGVT